VFTLRSSILTAGFACLILAGTSLPVVAEDSEETEPYRTPRAGEAFTATVFGHSVDVPERDRTKTTVLDLGVQLISNGPGNTPFATVYLWRNWHDGRHRLRAISSASTTPVRYDFLPWRGARSSWSRRSTI
jgi:hypothetical protein